MGKQILDADLISLESMIAAKEQAESALRTMVATEAAANWTFWMLVVSTVSVLSSIAMLYYAFRALSTWREQEQMKVKVDFKKSLIRMRDLLIKMPNGNLTFMANIGRNVKRTMSDDRIIANSKELDAMYKKDALEEEYVKAEHNWAICEELFDGEPISENWKKFKDMYFTYAKLNGDKNGLDELLSTMKSDLVIFESKKSFKRKLVETLTFNKDRTVVKE